METINTMEKIKQLLKTEEYDFLRNDENLGNNIILLTLGGSWAYGTNIETSDVDIRGIALNSKEELLTNINFEQRVNEATDTTIYSFNKIISLLSNVNPNTIEILGCKPEHYLYLSPIGKELLDNKDMFLSKRCVHAFAGYANAQLRRLDNKANRLVDQSAQEKHILNSIENARYSYPSRFFSYPSESIKLYTDVSHQDEMDMEIYMDVNLKHYPLRDYKGMWADMNNIVKEYSKIGHRNNNAIEKGKLSKHMMHLVRLFLMCLDILDHGEINTYREKDHDFLMSIRNGKYLDDNRQPTAEFFDIVTELEAKLQESKEKTKLPDLPDYNRINKFMMSVNERIVKGEL